MAKDSQSSRARDRDRDRRDRDRDRDRSRSRNRHRSRRDERRPAPRSRSPPPPHRHKTRSRSPERRRHASRSPPRHRDKDRDRDRNRDREKARDKDRESRNGEATSRNQKLPFNPTTRPAPPSVSATKPITPNAPAKHVNGTTKVPSNDKSPASKPTKIDRMDIDTPKAEEEEEDEETALMRKLMGFGKFKTTKQTKVPGNDIYAVRKEKKTEYRQYMNRVGGFNRPLSPSR